MMPARGSFRYIHTGVANVRLRNVEIRRCGRCRAWELVTPNIDTLHRSIARGIVERQRQLRSDEIRFLRTWLGLSCGDLAAAMGVRRETAFRWERRDAHFPMTPTADRLLRLLVANRAQGPTLSTVFSSPTPKSSQPLDFVAPEWKAPGAGQRRQTAGSTTRIA